MTQRSIFKGLKEVFHNITMVLLRYWVCDFGGWEVFYFALYTFL